ncbi:hypothetical protein [Methanothermobacter tenebrarum]|uniref:Uncharacterized protein n=1 Tax=Methanothermobacter tenebrarum TaxID=680118 RepID=A0A328PIJ1_9EURY|nr:hypothetical protein [Methanothermobacter tenebrarum]NPV64068.1 hypothetical protein [Methanobacteriaceae archaeon]RAO79234.1 hypothetical protein DPC56_04770 [Methanothermobacter tenebrarum]
MRSFAPLFLLAAIMMSIVGMAYYQPVTAQASESTTQTLQANVSDTIAITATWAGTENGTINLGNVPADNFERSWEGGDTAEQVHTYSNVAIDLYVRAAGDLTKGADKIALDNLKYDGYANDTLQKTAFDTTYALVKAGWGPPSQGAHLTVPVDLFLTVPFATPPGVYTTTIYHAAVQAGGTEPTTP